MRAKKNSVYFSVSLQSEEKEKLDRNAMAAGLPRNRYVRNWISDLPDDPEPEPKKS